MFGSGKTVAVAATTLILALTGCGGGDTAKVDPATWPNQWCNVHVGDTPDRAIELMGEPTSDGRSGPSASMSWSYREFQFNAFLDSSDRIRQLDINDLYLSDAQKAGMRCGTLRDADDPGGFEQEAADRAFEDQVEQGLAP